MDGKNKPCYPVTRADGFTLIELISVAVIIATLGAVALPRFVHNDATVPAQADQLGRVIRHAQAMAMSQGQAFTVEIQTATTYTITDGTTATPERDAAGEEQAYTLINAVILVGPDVEFDSLGRPLNGLALATTPQNWTLTGPGGNAATVNIQPVTGFVSVTP